MFNRPLEDMVELLRFVPPVLSALLGAVAIRLVEVISAKRGTYKSIHYEMKENYSRIEAEIRRLDSNEWDGEFEHLAILDAIETSRYRAPTVYINVISEVNRFQHYTTEMENLRQVQLESKTAGAALGGSEESVRSFLERQLRLIETAEEDFVRFGRGRLWRRLLISPIIDPLEEPYTPTEEAVSGDE